MKKNEVKPKTLDIVEHMQGDSRAYVDKDSAEWFVELIKPYAHCYGFDGLSLLKDQRAKSGYVYELYSNDVEFMPYDLANAMGLLS